MTVNVGKTLVNWNSTSDGVAVGLILKSGTSAGSNTSISTCRIFDPSATTSNLMRQEYQMIIIRILSQVT